MFAWVLSIAVECLLYLSIIYLFINLKKCNSALFLCPVILEHVYFKQQKVDSRFV